MALFFTGPYLIRKREPLDDDSPGKIAPKIHRLPRTVRRARAQDPPARRAQDPRGHRALIPLAHQLSHHEFLQSCPLAQDHNLPGFPHTARSRF